MPRIGMYLAVATSFLLLLIITPSEAATSCQDATAASVNGTLLLGTWFEAARKPIGGGNNTEECIQLIVNYENMTVSASITYSSAPYLWINQTTTNTLQVNQTYVGNEAPQVFTAVFYFNANGVNTTLKILETDYSSYMLSCAYTTENTSDSTTGATSTSSSSSESTTISSSSSASTSNSSVSSTSTSSPLSTTTEAISSTPAGAFILTRERQVNSSVLTNLLVNAKSMFSDFTNLSNVTQSSECYNSGSGTTVPFLAVVMTILYTLLKIVQ